MTSKPLPNTWSLITDSWNFFVKNWNSLVKISIWFLYAGLARFGSSVVDAYLPDLWIISLLLTVVALFFILIGQLRIFKAVLNIEAGKAYLPSRAEIEEAMRQFPSLFWIMILQGLIVLAGTIFLILPGIYLSILLTFSSLMFLAHGKRGTNALQASRELVNGRWWATFGRLIAGGLVFGVAVGIVAGIVVSIIMAIANPTKISAMGENSSQSILFFSSIDLFQSIIQAAVMPLFISFQVKLFHALEKTR